MRQILIEYGRSRKAHKRLHQKVELSEDLRAPRETSDDRLDIQEALLRLGEANPLWEQIVRLRAIQGFTAKETAKAVHMGESTARREWTDASRWLRHQLNRSGNFSRGWEDPQALPSP